MRAEMVGDRGADPRRQAVGALDRVDEGAAHAFVGCCQSNCTGCAKAEFTPT